MNSRVRAIIIDQNKILLIKRVKPDLTYWVFPGGAVEKGESREEALIRECKEELGFSIKVNDLFFKLKSAKSKTKGQIEHFYFCKIISGKLGTGNGPEYKPNSSYQGSYILEWVNIADLSDIDLKPITIKDLIYNKFNLNEESRQETSIKK